MTLLYPISAAKSAKALSLAALPDGAATFVLPVGFDLQRYLLALVERMINRVSTL